MKLVLVIGLMLGLCGPAFAGAGTQLDFSRFGKDLSVTTGKVADKAITAGKMSSGAATTGQVATADGSGNVTYQSLPVAPTWSRTVYTVLAADITAQTLTFPVQCISGSESISVQGLVGNPSTDFTLSVVASHTVAALTATTGWGTGSETALVADDVVIETCQH